jgi:NDP-sugar pyrophosphorylase family protein
MDVRAILIVGGAPDSNGGPESFAGMPLALLDVLGASVVERMATRLAGYGVEEISVIAAHRLDASSESMKTLAPRGANVRWISGAEDIWRASENQFSEYAQAGAELVVAIRLGAYAELNFDDLLQFHLDQKARVTSAQDAQGQFGAFVISASRRNDAAYLFRHGLTKCRAECAYYDFSGHVNRLRTARDLHRLAQDALFRRIELAPAGRELRPGVWVGEGARIERGTRILAPAFIGSRARVRAAAVITRGSVLEHHAEVDCGSVIEASALLPFSYVGAGLDVCHSLVGFKRIAQLQHNLEVEIADPKLLSQVSTSASRRLLGKLAGSVKLAFRVAPKGLAPPSSSSREAEGIQASAQGNVARAGENIPAALEVDPTISELQTEFSPTCKTT